MKQFPNHIFPMKPKEPEKIKKTKFGQIQKEEKVLKNPIEDLNAKSRHIIFDQKDLTNM